MESKLKEETAILWKKLEEERVARVKAEENYKLIQNLSLYEIERLKKQLEEANKPHGLPFPFNILLPFPFKHVTPKPPPCAIL